MARRWLAPETAADLGRLDPEAIARVREEAWPDPRERRRAARRADLARLSHRREVASGAKLGRLARGRSRGRSAWRKLDAPAEPLWVAAERLPLFLALWPERALEPPIAAPRGVCRRETGRARKRWSRSCAAGLKVWGR